MHGRRWTRPATGILAASTAGYSLAAVLFTWPLVRHLSTKLTGLPGSDLGVYLWNLWVFRRELAGGGSPLRTTSIFSLDTPVDLSLHNYTIFTDVLAAPLLGWFDVVTVHNVLVLVNFVIASMAMFLLAHYVARRAAIAWLAGLLFGFSPMLMARADIHPSLAAAAPLPLFVLALFRLNDTRSPWWAAGLGAIGAWAAVSDPYYAVYCALLGAWFLWTVAVKVRWSPWQWRPASRWVNLIDGAILGILALSLTILATGGLDVRVGALRVGLHTLYTPNLLLAFAVTLRAAATIRPRLRLRPGKRWRRLLPLVGCSAATAALILSPILAALVRRWLEGRYVEPRIFWRTSTPGADLMSFFVPNPNHPWLGQPWRAWLEAEPGGFAENVTSVSIAAVLAIAAAIRYTPFRIPRFWGGLALWAGVMTLGPFLRVSGLDTHLPTPWALLRYAPVIGIARTPARFAVLVVLAVSVIFALALRALAVNRPGRRAWPLAACAALLVVELCPAPKPLHDGRVPSIYRRVAADTRDVRILELPFGVRDGLSSFGDFSASSQFYQTVHGKRLIGGYLSRVSPRRVESVKRRPVLAVLMDLSEGRPITAEAFNAAVERGPRFAESARVAYVVIDRARARPELVDVARRVLDLEKIDQSGSRELYRPRVAARLGARENAESLPALAGLPR